MRRSRISMIIFISTTMFLVVSLGNGCSKDFKSLTSSSTGGSTTDTGSDNSQDTVIPGTKTAALVDSNQVLSHLTSCIGVAQASDQTIQMYETKKSSISASGTANTITSPMMMAIANINGEICNDLIEQEKINGKRIFVNIDFAANSVPSNSLLTDVISRISLSCWQRQATSTEISLLLQMINSVGATETLAARKASLLLCTAMLTSLDSLLN